VEDGLIAYEAINTPISEIVVSVTEKLKLNYYIFSELKGNATLSVSKCSYENFLKKLIEWYRLYIQKGKRSISHRR
jgi:type IV pilus assembly protein PilQ